MNNDQRDEKLTEIHTAVTILAAEAQEGRRITQEVKDAVFGNGKPGAILDIDRLKRFNKAVCWFLGGASLLGVGAILTVIGKLVYNSIVT